MRISIMFRGGIIVPTADSSSSLGKLKLELRAPPPTTPPFPIAVLTRLPTGLLESLSVRVLAPFGVHRWPLLMTSISWSTIYLFRISLSTTCLFRLFILNSNPCKPVECNDACFSIASRLAAVVVVIGSTQSLLLGSCSCDIPLKVGTSILTNLAPTTPRF